MKRHYYRLAGESLEALNRLIEFDDLQNNLKLQPLLETIRKSLPAGAAARKTKVDEADFATAGMKLATEFTAANVRGWQEKIGLLTPAVEVRSRPYDGGILYNAYNVFPRLGMTPGTSKKLFGHANLLKDKDEAEPERLAIYVSPEDYKGEHFVPRGAVPVTDDELKLYKARQYDFEYYNTYDEGREMPADFNPDLHKVYSQTHEGYRPPSHVFLVGGKARQELLGYEKSKHDWIMSYQEFRDNAMKDALSAVTGEAHPDIRIWINDEAEGGRAVELTVKKDYWEKIRDRFDADFEVRGVTHSPKDGSKVRVVPRATTLLGMTVAQELAKVPPHPVKPAGFGFEEREALENSVRWDAGMTGFPYLKVERFEGGEVKLLALRLPPHVKGVAPPPDCTPVSLDDYVALAASEPGFDKNDLPTHVFRIGGESYDLLKDFDTKLARYTAAGEALKKKIGEFFPGVEIGEFDPESYRTDADRVVTVTIPGAAFAAAKDRIEESFVVDGNMSGGWGGELREIRLKPRRDSDAAAEVAALFDAIPKLHGFPKTVAENFGFFSNNQYDLMKVESFDDIGQKVVAHFFPPWITAVEAPPGTTKLTGEEFAQLQNDDAALRMGSPPPPRPAHLAHLPGPEASSHYAHIMGLKSSKDADGLSLHEKSDPIWPSRLG